MTDKPNQPNPELKIKGIALALAEIAELQNQAIGNVIDYITTVQGVMASISDSLLSHERYKTDAYYLETARILEKLERVLDQRERLYNATLKPIVDQANPNPNTNT